jgi:PAS domain S-box-containing protein
VFISRTQIAELINDYSRVGHTHQALLELSESKSLLVYAETSQRGYLYTGNPAYLEPYDQAVAQVGVHIDNLASLTADDPAQQNNIIALRGIAQEKIAELNKTISLFQSGHPAAAKALVMTDTGILDMGSFRHLIEQMKQDETTIVDTRTAIYRRSATTLIVCGFIESAITAIGLLLLAYVRIRQLRLNEELSVAARQSEEWFRVTLTCIGDGVIATDAAGHVIFLNPVAETLTGISLDQAMGKPVEQVFPIFNETTLTPVVNPVGKVLEHGKVVGLANHTVLRRPNGSHIPIEDSAAPIRDDQGAVLGAVLVFRDATKERKSQEVLRKTEKLASAARFAATVAHEINNPLEAIGNLLYIVRTTPGLPASSVENLALAEQELDRVAHISRQTLGFYRESKTPVWVDVPAIIDYVLKIYANKLKTNGIAVECEFGACPPIHGLPGELTQLLANLISNAADAVASNGVMGDSGLIKVRTSAHQNGSDQFVQIEIEDNGPGITPANLLQIFEPFFTTKEDVGTGLGLWVAREIVTRHGGTISTRAVEGAKATGAIFTIQLPVRV